MNQHVSSNRRSERTASGVAGTGLLIVSILLLVFGVNPADAAVSLFVAATFLLVNALVDFGLLPGGRWRYAAGVGCVAVVAAFLAHGFRGGSYGAGLLATGFAFVGASAAAKFVEAQQASQATQGPAT